MPFSFVVGGGGRRNPFNDTRAAKMFSDAGFFVIVDDFLKKLVGCHSVNRNVSVIIDVFILL